MKYFFFLLFICQNFICQNKYNITVVDASDSSSYQYKWLGFASNILTADMKAIYQKPAGFTEVNNGTECFKAYSNKMQSTFNCRMNRLNSNDGEFVAFLGISPVLSQKFEKEVNELFPGKNHDLVDKHQSKQIIYQLKTYNGEEYARNWKKNVYYYPSKEAKKLANADTLISFNIDLEPVDFFEKKYKYSKTLVLQKEGRGNIFITTFYTDQAKENLPKYWKQNERIFWYRDDK